MKKVYLPTFGSGLGHASRMALVARELVERGVELAFSSSEEGLDYLVREGFECRNVPSIDLGWDDEAGLLLGPTLLKIPRNTMSFAEQVRLELQALREFQPDLVLSDSRFSALLAARSLGVPSIAILNQIRILGPRRADDDGGSPLEELGAQLLSRLWSIADDVLLPDFPPPYTISERNLWGIEGDDSGRSYVGTIQPRTRMSKETVKAVSRRLGLGEKPLIFAPISGPRPTKEALIRKLISIGSGLTDLYDFVISGGEPKGAVDPISNQGVWYYPWCPCPNELFSLADTVVIRGGHSSITQAISFGKPIIAIPIENQSEQIANTQKVARLGMGICLRQSELTVPTLARAFETVIHDGAHRSQALKMKRLAEQYDGLSNVVSRVMERLAD